MDSNTDTAVVDLESPAHGGTMIARVDGRVVFVRGGAPGDKQVRIAFDDARGAASKNFRTAQVIDVAQPSEHRVEGLCAAAREGAGCCDLDFLDTAGSMAFKRDVVIDQFRRIGKIEIEEEVLEEIILEPHAAWRTRTRLGAAPAVGPPPSTAVQPVTVGLRKARSREVVDVQQALCAQWSPELARGIERHLPTVQDLLADYDANSTTSVEIAIAVGNDGHCGFELLETVPLERPTSNRRGKRRSGRRHERTGEQRRHAGSTRTSIRPLGDLPTTVRRELHLDRADGTPTTVTWDLPAHAFWQGHRAAVDTYARWVDRVIPAAVSDAATGWDLYGGSGVFSAVLAAKVSSVVCVDVASSATSAGEAALASAGIERVRFVDADVARAVPGLSAGDELHAVVLDPPRTGAGVAVVRSIAHKRPTHVVHIGCDPATAARDIAAWVAEGYRVERVAAVDAFGLTHHVEVLAYLVRE